MHFTPHYSSMPASAYYDKKAFDMERQHIFNASWLLVAVTSEIAQDGDYIAREILGVPVLIWNIEGEYRAYINVCPHRHTLLVNQNSAGSGEILRCPYHGWEFNGSGHVCKIPEAQCFKGLKKEGSLALKAVQLECLGSLLFICFNEGQVQSLAEFIGEDVYKYLQHISKRATALVDVRHVNLPCNWKLMFENGIEDYHTPLIHKTSIGMGLDLKNSNYFYCPTDNNNGCLMAAKGDDSVSGFNIFAPFLAISVFSGLHITVNNQGFNVATFEQELPVSPTTSQRILWVMCSKRLDAEIKYSARDDVFKVMQEDEALMANNQKAKEHAFTPQLLGLYESRISMFHEFLQRKLGCTYVHAEHISYVSL